MKIIWGINRERNNVAVIPTSDVRQDMTMKLLEILDREGVDSLLIEDSLPELRFSKSMNRGIDEVLKKDYVEHIILSNDDITEITCLGEMISTLSENANAYIHPFVNHTSPYVIITGSPLRFLINNGIRNLSPFYSLNLILKLKWYGNRNKLWMGTPAFNFQSDKIVNVQPFGVFPAYLLRDNRFDENFVNGVEDIEFAFRLNRKGFKGITNPRWNVTHKGAASFRKFKLDNSATGNYTSDEETLKAMKYFRSKYQ